jgi:hypothetical protein
VNRLIPELFPSTPYVYSPEDELLALAWLKTYPFARIPAGWHVKRHRHRHP